MQIVQPPTSQFCRGIWIFLLLESPVRAAEHLSGRYIQLTGWDSHLGGGEPSPLSHSSFPPLSQRPGPTSCDRKILGRHQKPPGVFGRAAHPAPRELECFASETLLPTGSLLSFPLLAPQHRTALTRSGNSGTPDLQRPSRSIPPLPGRGDRFRVHSPGRLAVGGGRVSGSAAELLPFRLLLAGAAGCLELVAGGSGTGVATGAPAAEPEVGGREEDSRGCARARKAGAMSGT